MTIRITTWNVNGIRNPFGYQPWSSKRTFDNMFDILEADIVIMQELKIQRKDLRDDMVLVPGWDCYFSLPKHKKGYSGVGIYTRQSVCAPIRAEEGVLGVLCPPGSSKAYCDLHDDQHIGGYLSIEQLEELGMDAAELDAEGRCVVLEFPAFVIFGIYSPANSSGTRSDFRYGFLNAVDVRVRNLIKEGKRVIVTGDLNVSRTEMDTAGATENNRKEGITHDQYISTPNRRIFNQLVEGGAVAGERDEGREKPVLWDICRGFHPNRSGMFTHWEQKINARPGNFGSRIDFILCSLDMKGWFSASDIQEGLMGSDHCPVYAVIKDEVDLNGASVNAKDLMSASGIFKDGQRLKEYSAKDIPAFSGKLLPEFDKRRSIKDMFGKMPSLPHSNSSINATPATPSLPAPETTLNPTPTVAADTQLNQALEASSTTSVPTKAESRQTPPSTLSQASRTSSPDQKRKASDTTSRTAKRSKSSAKVQPEKPTTNGQQSLKGFFVSKSPSAKPDQADKASTAESALPIGSPNRVLPVHANFSSSKPNDDIEETVDDETNKAMQDTAFATDTPHDDAASSAPDPPPPPDGAQEPESPTTFIDPIVSKESWSKMFTKPSAPKCEHDEPCKTMKTRKAGFNCGREFWMCQRPLGPSGNKERGTQWRCPTFIWTSDFNGTTEQTT